MDDDDDDDGVVKSYNIARCEYEEEAGLQKSTG